MRKISILLAGRFRQEETSETRTSLLSSWRQEADQGTNGASSPSAGSRITNPPEYSHLKEMGFSFYFEGKGRFLIARGIFVFIFMWISLIGLTTWTITLSCFVFKSTPNRSDNKMEAQTL